MLCIYAEEGLFISLQNGTVWARVSPEATALKNTAELKMVQEKRSSQCASALNNICIIIERFVNLAARHSSL